MKLHTFSPQNVGRPNGTAIPIAREASFTFFSASAGAGHGPIYSIFDPRTPLNFDGGNGVSLWFRVEYESGGR